MRRHVRLAGLLLALAVISLPAMADKASSAFKKGADAEARSNYEQAYEYYKQAYELKPKEIKYRAAFTRIRFYASSAHVHHGQQLRDQGKLQEALAEFETAVAIDPANFYAAQELKRTQKIIQDHKNGPNQSEEDQSGLTDLAEHAAGPVELHPISNTPITLRMTEDSKNVYTAIGKIAGLNVLFDPDYTSRRITIDLNGVSLYQALEIVALESKTFYRPVTPNTIFVASDTPAKRKELEQSVIKTFYLGNVSSPNDLQDAVNTIRQILDVQRIQQVTTQNAIVVRGTPDQIAMAEKLLNDIDKAKPEVVVEIAIMQVRRDKARTLGLQPPTSASIQLAPNTTTTSSNSNNNSNNTTTTTNSNNNGINLNDLANLTAKDFQVTIPAASFQALMTDANTKLIQNPQIRALDNQKATLKIGDRIPVATGSFQPGIGGVGINPLVNTQFQYIDVGVNIDITPRIHADREVTLKLTMEVSNVTGQSNIGGISQPIIGQRRIEHEIRLREGEVNLLGGILEDSQQISINGFPFLSKIPILRYLFSQENKQDSQNEIVFALIPHIVRGIDVSDLNNEAVDVGTATGIELRRSEQQQVAPEVQEQQRQQTQPANRAPQQQAPPAAYVPPPSPQDVTAAAQQGVPVVGSGPGPMPQQPQPGLSPGPPSSGSVSQQPAAQAQPMSAGQAQATQQPQQQGTLQAGNAVLSFEPASLNEAVNSTFVVNVSMSNANNVYSVPTQITYDPKILQLVNVSNGGFLGKDGQPVALVHRDDPTSGTLQITATRPPGSGGVNGQGPVFSLTFMAKATGQATISVSRAGARDPSMQAIPVAGGQAMVTVK